MLTKEQKQSQFEELRDSLSEVSTLFVLRNRGLKVNEVNELRANVRKTEAVYRVYKNSVVRLAIQGTRFESLGPHLKGPNAFAFTEGDPISLAKALREFIKTHPALSFEKAFLEGHILESEEAQKVAELPSKTELISRLLFLLQSPMRRLATALNGPLQKFASALNQIADQKES